MITIRTSKDKISKDKLVKQGRFLEVKIVQPFWSSEKFGWSLELGGTHFFQFFEEWEK